MLFANERHPAVPDMFEVMNFGSVEGAFANQQVDLGNGLFLTLNLDDEQNKLTLITTT